MGLIVFFIIILAIESGLYFLFPLIGITQPFVVDVLIDVVLAFIFAIVYYRGDRKRKWKDPSFHMSVFKYFLVLFILSVIVYFLF